MKAKLTRAALVLVGIAGILFAVRACRDAMWSLEAEKTLQAFSVLMDVLTNFVDTNSGKWPSGWDDLARIPPSRANSTFSWPEDIERIRSRVRINFDLTTAQVISAGESRFVAIEQIGPNFGPDEPSLHRFFDVARRKSETFP
jgi:hypothetical protein